MNILFSVGNLEQALGASNKIAVVLAEEISRQGHFCLVAGCYDGPSAVDVMPNKTRLQRFHMSGTSFVSKINRYSAAAYKVHLLFTGTKGEEHGVNGKLLFAIRHPIHAFVIWCDRRYDQQRSRIKAKMPEGPKAYRSAIARLIRQNHIDAVFCFQEPLWAEWQVFQKELSCPRYVYQVDPCGLQEYELPLPREKRVELEIDMFGKAGHIFTTPVLLSQYQAHPLYERYTQKMTAMEFPNVVRPSSGGESEIAFDASYTNILFCGMVYDGYRSPAFFLEQFRKLVERGARLRCYFLGDVVGDDVADAVNQMPQQVFRHSRVSMDTAFATMDKADILLNLGNTLENMVPSKIFDYFSLGKPIINVQKIPNCPAAAYFARYPLQYTIKDYEKPSIQDELLQFIKNAAGKTVPFEEVETLYAAATPRFVAGQIMNVLKGYANGRL